MDQRLQTARARQRSLLLHCQVMLPRCCSVPHFLRLFIIQLWFDCSQTAGALAGYLHCASAPAVFFHKSQGNAGHICIFVGNQSSSASAETGGSKWPVTEGSSTNARNGQSEGMHLFHLLYGRASVRVVEGLIFVYCSINIEKVEK